jgi:hypothetical protein
MTVSEVQYVYDWLCSGQSNELRVARPPVLECAAPFLSPVRESPVESRVYRRRLFYRPGKRYGMVAYTPCGDYVSTDCGFLC